MKSKTTHCTECFVELNEKNKKANQTRICKPCHNKKVRIIITCKYCHKVLNEGLKRPKETCSIDCKIKSVSKILENGCIQSISSSQRNNSPTITFGGRIISIRRYIYEQKHGKQSKRATFIENCSTKYCIKIEHIETDLRRQSTLKKIRAGELPSRTFRKLNSEIIQDIAKKRSLGWSIRDIEKEIKIVGHTTIQTLLTLEIYKNPITKVSNGSCINCRKNHENTQSNYCSTECMQQWINS